MKTPYQQKLEEWQAVYDRVRLFNTKVWEIVRPSYDETNNCTTIKYEKQIRKGYITIELLASREWTSCGDARLKLEKAGYLESQISSSSGRYSEWVREDFDYLVNYQIGGLE